MTFPARHAGVSSGTVMINAADGGGVLLGRDTRKSYYLTQEPDAA
jgi:hypothetical protein